MAGSKRCAKCKKNLGLEQFPLKVQTRISTPSHTSTCFPCQCTEKKKAHRQSRKALKQKNGRDPASDEPPSDEEAPGPSDRILPGVLSLKDFLVFLGGQKDVLTVEARITIGELSEYDRRKRADAIVHLMWEVMNYRFLCVSMVL